ncbi:MAG TPA: hypothetical protein VMT03_17915 [Polyangia bacterium]|nr:hypothetical protein [Polyangia bacterium]
MSKLPGTDPNPQAHAVEIVADGLRVLRTRDAVPLTDEQIVERARNIITGLLGAYHLVPARLTEVVEGLREATSEFRLAADGVRLMLQAEARR